MKRGGLFCACAIAIAFALTPSTLAEANVKVSPYTIPLKVEKTNTVYNASGKKIGTLAKGKKVKLINHTKKQGVIRFQAKQGYVNLKNYKHYRVVDGSKAISYEQYRYYVEVLALLYPEAVTLKKIGKSADGRSIYAYRLGTGKKEVYIDASTHAREHMTTNVVMAMIDTYTKGYINKKKLAQYDVEKLLSDVSIWFVPMVNPDGVMLVQQGLRSVSAEKRAKVLAYNGNSKNFARYKANIRGVDLNRNYNVAWKQTSTTPRARSYQFYKGPNAVSEPETKAMVKFMKAHNFKTYIAYHSSGEILYWKYKQNTTQLAQHQPLVTQIQQMTGYRPDNTTGVVNGSGAGQDWFVSMTGKPGITIEIAPYAGNQPVPNSQWSSIWKKNKYVGLLVAKEAAAR